MKGKIPTTGGILLEKSDENHWNLIVNGLVKEITISGVVELSAEKRVRIKMVIKKVYPPDRIYTTTNGTYNTNLNEASIGLSRIAHHVIAFLESKKWILIGEIQGENKVPIVLVHYSLIKMTFYSQKTIDECIENFLPSMAIGGPSLN